MRIMRFYMAFPYRAPKGLFHLLPIHQLANYTRSYFIGVFWLQCDAAYDKVIQEEWGNSGEMGLSYAHFLSRIGGCPELMHIASIFAGLKQTS